MIRRGRTAFRWKVAGTQKEVRRCRPNLEPPHRIPCRQCGWELLEAGRRNPIRLPEFNFSIIGLYLSGDEFHQAAFALPVAAHQADALAMLKGKINLVQQGRPTKTEGEIFKG